MLAKFKSLKTETYSSPSSEYELSVYKSLDSDEIKVNISSGSQGKSILWTLDDLEIPPDITDENTLVEKCLSLAKSAITENDSPK